jgi:tRNA(Arg) A34 adenosine deaminase TadA
MSDTHYMRLAIQKAQNGIRKGQTPFGACIVKNGKVISCAHNAVWKKTDITAHAEIQAIRDACKRLESINLSGCVIYSTCEPCPMCFSACHWAGISKIVYGTSILDAKKIGFNELFLSNNQMKKIGRSPLKIKGGFLRDEALLLFKRWTTAKNRRSY